MITSHNLIQGSQEWHAFRAEHFGASEASAMLGLSPYKTRTQLLNEKKTGLVPEVNAATQAVFAKGHAVEALARPVVEGIIGEELSPMTYSNGKLSASCDGLSFMGDIAWECKQFNAAHYEQLQNGELPEIHWPQCQQVLYCTGAEKLFFTVSDGTEERTAGVWVYPDAEKQQMLVAGWDQFEKDLSTHEVEEVKQAPKAQAIIALPALAIQIKGEVTLSNLPEFKEAATAFISSINTELVTDEDFAQAEANVKFCKDAEDNIEATKKSAIAQTASIDDLMRTLDFISDQLRVKRLDLDKKVKSEKENRRLEIVTKARIALGEHFTSLEREIHPIELRTMPTDFAGAIKGKKTLSSMQDAVNSVLANAKIELDATAKDIRAKREWLKENADGYQMLFADMNNIIYKPMDDLQVLVKSRIADHKQKEAEREAAIKAQAEANAKAKVEAERLASADKLITAGDAINESDFNHVFEVKEQETRSEKSIKITRRPALTEIVNLVANEWNVNPDQAYQWLFESFAEAKAA